MKITVLVSMAIALTVMAGQGAMADPEARNHGVNKPAESQKDRAQQGVKSAELTSTEVGGTASELSDIEKLQRKYLADGVFTSAERKELEKQIKDRQDLRQRLDQQR